VTQADIARAICAAGYSDVRVVFKDGAVIVEPAQEDASGRRSAKVSVRPKREIIL
jgi:hypothetical protein